jgi:hypothetical protein
MKRLLLLFVFAIATLPAMSQLRIGLNFSPAISINRVFEDKDSTFDYSPNGAGIRFIAGPELSFMIGKNYAFTTGLWYAAKRAGITIKDKISGKETEETYNLQYIQLPATLKLFTNEIATDMRLYFQIGGTADIKLATKEKKINVTPDIVKFRPFDTSILAGVGIEYQLGENTYLLGGLRYTRGLINSATRFEDAVNEFRINNDLISIDMGIRF